MTGETSTPQGSVCNVASNDWYGAGGHRLRPHKGPSVTAGPDRLDVVWLTSTPQGSVCNHSTMQMRDEPKHDFDPTRVRL